MSSTDLHECRSSIDPLPKRLRKSRAVPQSEAVSSEKIKEPFGRIHLEQENGNKTASSDDNTIGKRHDQVEENIESRRRVVRAVASLETRDGVGGEFFEYLDHTADVQFHVWGNNFSHAIEHMAQCMFNYITDLSTIDIDDKETIEFQMQGHDLQSLLYNFMDELLFRFSTDGFCCAKIEVKSFDRKGNQLFVKAFGEKFDQTKHPQGTEIKAITYSNMQIHEQPDRTDLYVIVDI